MVTGEWCSTVWTILKLLTLGNLLTLDLSSALAVPRALLCRQRQRTDTQVSVGSALRRDCPLVPSHLETTCSRRSSRSPRIRLLGQSANQLPPSFPSCRSNPSSLRAANLLTRKSSVVLPSPAHSSDPPCSACRRKSLAQSTQAGPKHSPNHA